MGEKKKWWHRKNAGNKKEVVNGGTEGRNQKIGPPDMESVPRKFGGGNWRRKGKKGSQPLRANNGARPEWRKKQKKRKLASRKNTMKSWEGGGKN